MNESGCIVISGARNYIEAIRASLRIHGVRCNLLDISLAFCFAQMDPMLKSLKRIAQHVPFRIPSTPVVFPLLNDIIFDGKTVNAEYRSRACREPANFVGAVEACEDVRVLNEWGAVGLIIRGHNLSDADPDGLAAFSRGKSVLDGTSLSKT